MNELSIKTYGDSSSPALLFGHSYLWDHFMWSEMVEVLKADYYCLVLDLWAHGDAGCLPETVTSLEDYPKEILNALDKLGVDQFHIIGLSVGGMWGSLLATSAAERVQTLTLMGTFLGEEPETTKAQYFEMLQAIDRLGYIPPPIVDQVSRGFFHSENLEKMPKKVEYFHQKLKNYPGDKINDLVKVGFHIFGREDHLGILEQIHQPSLVIVGQGDIYRPPRESQLMVARLPNSQYVELQDCGHISAFEMPELCSSIINKFLKENIR
ncbi:MAG: alpha/beta hydrolase [Lentisphaeria bacterium]|nr:alpha/beta hydrolase [Lentisphaeria bacterium]